LLSRLVALSEEKKSISSHYSWTSVQLNQRFSLALQHTKASGDYFTEGRVYIIFFTTH